MKMKHLLFGAAYYSEYLPYHRIDKDMDMMAQAGMNTIRIAESTWSTLEPQDNIFDFNQLDLMIDAAQRHNLSVIIGTPTYAVPTWLVRKHPDILPVTHDGQALYGHRQNMDITNPHYLFHCERVIRRLLDHVKDIPHIIGFQIDNETKSYDTCSSTAQQKFVVYLKQIFPDINTFNLEFGLDYWSNRINSWDDFPDIRGCVNQSLNAEYKKFQRQLVTEFLFWQSEIIKEYIHDEQFITHNFDFQWIDYSFGYQPEVNQYDAARCMSVAGADIYHISQDKLTGAEITCCGNIARSLKNDNYLVLETQAQGNTEWLPYENQLRLQAYSHIANGANSVLYWHWYSIHNSFESYWKGVLSHDFKENATYKEACIIGNEWKRIGSHIINLQKKNQIGVILDNNSLTGLSEFPLETSGNLSYNIVMRWLTNSLFRLNLEYDMLSSDSSRINDYAYIIVPALYSATEQLLLSLNDYVANGGHLIATFKTAFSDEHLKIRHEKQPYLLNECLGIEYDQFTYPSVHAEICYNYAGHHMTAKCREWMELVSCITATPLGSYINSGWSGYNAITVNHYKKGVSMYLATMFDDDLLDTVLSDYISADSKCEGIHAPVIIKKGVNDYGQLLRYYFNYSNTCQTVVYSGHKGLELLHSKNIAREDILTIPAWDLLIIEEYL